MTKETHKTPNVYEEPIELHMIFLISTLIFAFSGLMTKETLMLNWAIVFGVLFLIVVHFNRRLDLILTKLEKQQWKKRAGKS